MAIALVGVVGAEAQGTTASISPAFGQATTAGNLLVATVVSGTNTAFTVSGATGWVNAIGAGSVNGPTRAEIWYKPNCGAGETAPTFNCTSAVFMSAQLTEWSGAATTSPLDNTGGANAGAVASLTVTCTTATTAAGDMGISAFTSRFAVNRSGTWTPGSGWTNLANDMATSQKFHFASDDELNFGSGVTVSEVGTDGQAAANHSGWAGAIATFKAVAVATPPTPTVTYAYSSN